MLKYYEASYRVTFKERFATDTNCGYPPEESALCRICNKFGPEADVTVISVKEVELAKRA
jgi:hypothetical protein